MLPVYRSCKKLAIALKSPLCVDLWVFATNVFCISTNQWSLSLQKNNITGCACHSSKMLNYCLTLINLLKSVHDCVPLIIFIIIIFYSHQLILRTFIPRQGSNQCKAAIWIESFFWLLVGVLSRLPFARYVAWWGHSAASGTPGHFPSEEQQCFDLWESSLSATRVRSCFPGFAHGVMFSCPLCVHCINTALQL